MSNEDRDINIIRNLLKRRKRNDLAKLLKQSRSYVNQSMSYGRGYNTFISSFEIYSPYDNYEKLKKLNQNDVDDILKAVIEIYPVEDNSYDIRDIVFKLDTEKIEVELDDEEVAGLMAICSVCHKPQGIFLHKAQLRKKIAKQEKCKNNKCNAPFQFMPDGNIWNLEVEILPTKEEYIINLLKEYSDSETQLIYCYEDKGPEVKINRYPSKLLTSSYYEWTYRATPAFAFHFHPKGKRSIDASYCFDSPAALLQLAREALKGYYWLKYDLKKE